MFLNAIYIYIYIHDDAIQLNVILTAFLAVSKSSFETIWVIFFPRSKMRSPEPGHQWSNFPKIHVLRQIMVNISKTIINRTDLQRALDSPGRAHITFFRQT